MINELEIDVLALPHAGVTTLLAGMHLRLASNSVASPFLETQKEILEARKLLGVHHAIQDRWLQVHGNENSFRIKVLDNPEETLRSLIVDSSHYSADRFLLFVVNPLAIGCLTDGKQAVRNLVQRQCQSSQPASMQGAPELNAVKAAIRAVTGLEIGQIVEQHNQDLVDVAWNQLQPKLGTSESWDAILKILREVPNSGLLLTYYDIRGRWGNGANTSQQLLQSIFNQRQKNDWPKIYVDDGVSIVTALIDYTGPDFETAKTNDSTQKALWSNPSPSNWIETKLLQQLNIASKKIKRSPPLQWYRKVGAVLLWPTMVPVVGLIIIATLLWPVSGVYLAISETPEANTWERIVGVFAIVTWTICMPVIGVAAFCFSRNRVIASRDQLEKLAEDSTELYSVPLVSPMTKLLTCESSCRYAVAKELAPSAPRRGWTLKVTAEFALGFLLIALVTLLTIGYCFMQPWYPRGFPFNGVE